MAQKTIEELLAIMREHDAFIIEVSKGKFMFLKVPEEVDGMRSMESVFTLHNRRDVLQALDRVKTTGKKMRLYNVGQYDREGLKAWLRMLRLFPTEDLITELRIYYSKEELEKINEPLEESMKEVFGDDYTELKEDEFDAFEDDIYDQESEDIFDDEYYEIPEEDEEY